MTIISPGMASTKNAVSNMIDCNPVPPVVGAFSDELNLGSGVREVVYTITTAFECVLDGISHTIPTQHIHLNTADVLPADVYYVYIELVGSVPTLIASTTNPSSNPAVGEYFTLSTIRFSSSGGTLNVFYSKFPSQTGIYELAHDLKEDALYFNAIWLSGLAPSFSTGGKISTTAGYVRFPGNEPRSCAIVTNGPIALENDSIVAGLDNITTYADGSAIGAGDYHKLLLGILRDKSGYNTSKFLVIRQTKPSVPYADAATAKADALECAAVVFPADYLGAVTPLAYIVTKSGDYTGAGFEAIDLRESGIVKGAGGATVTNHSTLSGLANDDHTQYLNTTRHDTTTRHSLGTVVPHDSHSALSNLAADDHTQYYNVTRHTKVLHDGLAIDHGSLTGLADDDHTQYLLASGGRALTGNLSVDALVTIDGVDISAHAANASAHHAPVTLSTEADAVLQLSTQAIDLDTQTASYALMGPAAGASAAKPTFRAIVPADMLKTEGTMNLSNGQNDNVALTAGVDLYTVAGPTGAFGFSGFTGGYGGRRIVIMNSAVNKNMTAYHQNTSSTAANRIICPGAMADTATANYGVMVFEYFATTQRWVMISIIT